MSRLEKILIGIFLGVLSPFLLFILFWWGAAGLILTGVAAVSEKTVAASALLGLAFGLALNVRYLKSWVVQFYHLEVKYLIALYVFCSLPAVAFFMGLPIGNLALGALAGIYLGRKGTMVALSEDDFRWSVRKGSRFTALVTAGEVLPIGLLALEEGFALDILRSLTGLDYGSLTGLSGILIIVFLTICLALLQYGLTRWSAIWVFRISAA